MSRPVIHVRFARSPLSSLLSFLFFGYDELANSHLGWRSVNPEFSNLHIAFRIFSKFKFLVIMWRGYFYLQIASYLLYACWMPGTRCEENCTTFSNTYQDRILGSAVATHPVSGKWALRSILTYHIYSLILLTESSRRLVLSTAATLVGYQNPNRTDHRPPRKSGTMNSSLVLTVRYYAKRHVMKWSTQLRMESWTREKPSALNDLPIGI